MVSSFSGSVASFAYAAVLSQDRQSWAYFDTFARLWELLAGALLALVVHRVALPRWSRTVLAVSGFAVVLGCGFLVDGAALFPGPAALIPVGAAVALILAGAGRSEQPGIVTMMASRPFVELGGLAYSLYLWHWPILIFYLTWRERPAVGALGGLAVILVSLVLAWLTQRLIEARFQTGVGPAEAGADRAGRDPRRRRGRDRVRLARVSASATPRRPPGSVSWTRGCTRARRR